MAETVTGLVLLSASSSEPQSIPGLPGLWSTEPELSVVPADLGYEVSDLAALASDLGFAVEEVEWERAVVEAEGDVDMSVSEIRERVESFDDETLSRLVSDSRKGAREAAEAEIERRASLVEPAEGEAA